MRQTANVIPFLCRLPVQNLFNMIQLTPDTVLDDKPFTHVDHTVADAAALDTLRRHLRTAVQELNPDKRDCQHHIEFIAESGKGVRLIIIRPQALLTDVALTVVGFCGHKRAHIHLHEQEEMARVDADLVAELSTHSHMLCYCSLEGEDGNWINLVLMSQPEGIQHWRGSARHMWAVDSLTPRFYRHIRLHNGELSAGLNSGRIVINSTKYFDYESEPPWRAMRQL